MSAAHPLADDPLLGGFIPTRRRLAAGEALFHQGDPVYGIFRLVSGRVRMLRTTVGGAQALMHAVRPNETFAEAALFSARYHCDAVADVDSEVLVYERVALAKRLRAEPDALWTFAGELARDVQALRTRIELKRTRSAADRVLQFLRLRADPEGGYALEGTLKQLAEELGMTHEALYRTLADLERKGLVARSRGKLRLMRLRRGLD